MKTSLQVYYFLVFIELSIVIGSFGGSALSPPSRQFWGFSFLMLLVFLGTLFAPFIYQKIKHKGNSVVSTNAETKKWMLAFPIVLLFYFFLMILGAVIQFILKTFHLFWF